MIEIPKINEIDKVPFKKRYIAAGFLGRAVGSQLRKQAKTQKQSNMLKIVDQIAAAKMPKLNRQLLTEQARSTLKEFFSQSKLWHGTGRYQYKDGKVTDVLDSIAKIGKLQPQYDDIDFNRPMESLSLARSRVYSRSYADMHGKGAAEPERYGTSALWAWIFLGDIGAEAMLEGRVWTKDGRLDTRDHFAQCNANDWYQKVRSSYAGTMTLFRRGSDIDGNYPIVFGVKDSGIETADTSHSIAIHEVRVTQPLSLKEDITHIEVPREKIEETQTLLRSYGHEVPILAIEDCEQFIADISFTELIQGKVLV